MKVWKLESDIRSITMALINYEEDRPKLTTALEGSFVSDWQPIKMQVTKKGIKTDLPYYFPGILLFSLNSINILNECIRDYVQYLQIENMKEFMLVNVINVIDCVDYSRSVSNKNRTGGFGGFRKISFIKEKLEKQFIFKIKEHVKTDIYVTDLFRDLVIASDLKGFNFIEIWDSEITEDMEESKQVNFNNKLREIEEKKGVEYNWSDVVDLVITGKSMASGTWKIKKDEDGVIFLGRLTEDLTYLWLEPIFYPPILFDLKWHEAVY